MAGSRRKSAYPIPLDAVDEVRTGSSVCSEWFREECMRRCHEGRKPRRGRGPSGRAGRPRWQRGPFWTHMAGPGAWPSRRHPNRPREPGIRQSMSRRACCWDNACIGSFWGRMEGQMGDAAHLPPGAMAPAGRYADRCSDRRGQERPGWLTPMEHAGRFTAWQCAEIGVHINSKILLSAPSGRKARAPQQPQAPGLPVHGKKR